MNYFKENNFDLVRLIAATQVVLFHSIEHLDLHYPLARTIVGFFPGVPAFFFMSGFLISASWERNPSLKVYAVNRFLRLYPAFVVVTLFSLIAILVLFEPARADANRSTLLTWLATQFAILPWTPEFLESYATGSINGSLWTIPVEVTFYVLTPLIYFLIRKSGGALRVLMTIVVASFAVQYAVYLEIADSGQTFALRLIKATAIPWVGMFCMGIVAQRHIERIYPWVAGKLPAVAAVFLGLAALSYFAPAYPLLKGNSNSMGLLNYLAMCALTLSIAYSYRSFSDRVLKRNDLSYGVYVFHMPVINILVHFGVMGPAGFVVAFVSTFVLATLSWFVIEKPALKLKRWALYKHTA